MNECTESQNQTKFDLQAMRSSRPSPGTWIECPHATAVLARLVFHGSQRSLREFAEVVERSCPDLLMSSSIKAWQRERDS